ncbi:hypothetical protein FO519_001059 [Halicephalobus sp. NKZ332]|nr:hypothetical protein FO519_001059 [Halicephalobus sp. NKZ332]
MTDTNVQQGVPVTVVIQYIWDFLVVIFWTLWYVIEGSFKALLPAGVLPRKDVRGKVVLITGTGSGIGRLCAIRFGDLGARLVLWDVNEKLNLETLAILKKNGVDAKAYTVDISDRKAIYDTAERVKKEVGDVDILFNNAGIVSGKKIFENRDELMEKTIAVNTTSLFFTTKAFLPKMLEKNEGHVATLASMAGKAGTAGLVDYCASKYGAVGFNESLRAEMASLGKNIHVTTICPYYINTGMFDGVETYAPLCLPILEPEYVADRIIEAILTNQYDLYLPKFSYVIAAFAGFLPYKAIFVIAQYLGVHHTMDHFTGRTQKKNN